MQPQSPESQHQHKSRSLTKTGLPQDKSATPSKKEKMKEKKDSKIIELDGRTGEGGGQLVRIACALASVATQPIRIINVRGNREGPRGGGM